MVDVDSEASTPSSEVPHEQPPRRSATIDVVEHRIDSDFDALKKRWRQNRKIRSENDPAPRQPYHEYIHRLLDAGWENLRDLDRYMDTASRQQDGLVISVLDIEQAFPDSDVLREKRWPDIYNEHDLKRFMKTENRSTAKIRLYLAEYCKVPATCVIESLGSALKLDPRFFNWAVQSKGHVLSPSQRHRAPFLSLGFGVLDLVTPSATDTEEFKVYIYIQPHEESGGWTGIVLFSSHTKLNLSPRIVTDPPPFMSTLPPPTSLEPRSFRELFLESFETMDLDHAVASPFYALSNLWRINCFCWNQVISAIREEDHRINGISDTSVGHSEEIQKSLGVIGRAGSLGWRGNDDEKAKEVKQALEEDFKHLVDQTELLWRTREKMASVRQKKVESRWTTLTNAFTYIFAPVTIISGIYGMNVSEISGDSSNPDIWQFFVAVAAFNFLVILALALTNWVRIKLEHGRTAGVKESFRYAVGGPQ